MPTSKSESMRSRAGQTKLEVAKKTTQEEAGMSHCSRSNREREMHLGSGAERS